MWEPQPLTTLRASKTCRGENFTFWRLKITVSLYLEPYLETLRAFKIGGIGLFASCFNCSYRSSDETFWKPSEPKTNLQAPGGNLAIITQPIAGRGSGAIWGMNSLRSLGGRDFGFESRPVHGSLICVRVFLLSSVKVEALRRVDHPSKEYCGLWKIKKLSNQLCVPIWERAPE
jgi:hypothetical protein